MNYLSAQITFQEVPDEVSLCFLITGCQLRCPGCHSAESWSAKHGKDLSSEVLEELLQKYHPLITCVCFLGGEWEEENLIQKCREIQRRGLKTCLYTGLEDVSQNLKAVLDYLKVGPYIKEKGGLSSPQTNQRMMNLKTNESLNHLFRAQGGLYGQAERITETK